MEQLSSHPLYGRHNLDSAMSSLWEFYKAKFLSLFVISFVMSLGIQYSSSFVNLQELSGITDPAAILEKMRELLVPILVISLINILFAAILQYYIIYNPLDRDVNIFVSALRSIKYLVPYLIVLILLVFAGSIAIVLGLFVLVVGAFFSVLYIMTIYLFILPIMMVEDANIGSTISRTVTLAHRNFWANIGWVAVFLILLIVISIISSGIVLLPFTGNFIKSITNPGDASRLADLTKNPLFMILSAMAGALTLPLVPIFSCILYFNGKAREDQLKQVEPVAPENSGPRVEDLYAKPYSDDHPDNPERKS
jgi:hypothetical protein